MEASDHLLEFRRTGGRAGNDEVMCSLWGSSSTRTRAPCSPQARSQPAEISSAMGSVRKALTS